MTILVIINVIIGLFISYFCLKELKFDFSLWTVGINFVVCSVVLGISMLPVMATADDISVLGFLASIMLILGVILLVLALVMNVPKKYGKNNRFNLGVILELAGIIVLVTLWHRPLNWIEVIVPELAIVIGLYLLLKNRAK